MHTKNYIPSEWKVNQDNIAALHARINKLEAEVAALKDAATTPEQIAQRAAERAENDAFIATLRCNK